MVILSFVLTMFINLQVTASIIVGLVASADVIED